MLIDTQRNTREELAAGYSSHFRKLEIASIVSFLIISLMIMHRLQGLLVSHAQLGVWAGLLGWVAADFVSGFVHWMGDTWGTTDWFLVGQTLIRTFREHHVDREAITRHDFIETNGTNCLISLPLMVFCVWLPAGPMDPVRVFIISFLFSLTLWVFATNQIHKWAHQSVRPGWVTRLQGTGLILSPEHHSAHHEAPFSRYYCITAGWLNPVLSYMGFFPFCERVITRLTGAIPREHDDLVTR
jgi:hypothetical protein